MNEFIASLVIFGLIISILGYCIGVYIQSKFKLAILNPILISIIFVILILSLCRIDYDTYNQSAKFLGYFLTPATICLAIPLYQQLELLKKHYKILFISIFTGVLFSLLSVLFFSILFHLSHAEYVTLLPKSITSAIGMALSNEMGGNATITVTIIIITGIVGNIFAAFICKTCKIRHAIARGIAIGTSSHVVGTAKAMEMGEIEGAMSSLSIVIAAIITMISMMVFVNFY